MAAPAAKITGMRGNPSARLVESVNSPMALFITPGKIINEASGFLQVITHQYFHLKDHKGSDYGMAIVRLSMIWGFLMVT
jgi:hypothetical protein